MFIRCLFTLGENMEKSNDVVLAVVDDGHFNNKGMILNRDGDPVRYVSPTVILSGHSKTVSLLEEETCRDYITKCNMEQDQDSDVYFSVPSTPQFGERDNMVDTQNFHYQLSEANRVMVHSMLHRMGLAGKKVKLVTTSPLKRYFKSNGDTDTDYINARNQNLMIPVTMSNGQSVDVVSCDQIPEGFAVFLSMLFNYKKVNKSYQLNMNRQMATKDILILDFGGETLDSAVISNGQLMVNKCCTIEGAGTLKIYEDVYDHLKSYRRNISRQELTQAIEMGKFFTDKKQTNEIDISEIVARTIRDTLSDGIDKVTNRTPLNEFDEVFIAGGTSITLNKYISALIPNALTTNDPLYDNAFGALLNLIREEALNGKAVTC